MDLDFIMSKTFIEGQEDIIKKRIQILNSEITNDRVNSFWGKIKFSIQTLSIELMLEFLSKDKEFVKLIKNISKSDLKPSIMALIKFIQFIPENERNNKILNEVGLSKLELINDLLKLESIMEKDIYSYKKNKVVGRSSTPGPIIKFIFELRDISIDITGKKPTLYRDRRFKNNSFGSFYDFFEDCYPSLIFKKFIPPIRPATIIDIFKKYKSFYNYNTQFKSELNRKYKLQKKKNLYKDKNIQFLPEGVIQYLQTLIANKKVK